MSEELIPKYLELLNKDLALESDEQLSLTKAEDPLKVLENHLTKLIEYLLNKDFNRLLNAVYRIDIPEEDFKQIMETSDPDDLGRNLAQRIIRRAIQKVELREKYRNQ